MAELQKYSLKEELLKKDEELKGSLSCLGISSLTQPMYINSMRSVMFTSHLKQFLCLLHPNFPHYFMNSENAVGKNNSGSFYEVENDSVVVAKIVKFKDIVEHPTIYHTFIFDKVNKRYDVVEREEVQDYIENFGAQINNDYFDSLEEGDEIKKGDVLYKVSTYDEDMNYCFGKDLLTMYTLDPFTSEDACEVRSGICKPMESIEVSDYQVGLNGNDYFINMYGDEVETKVIPDIGETCKGILCATRRQFNDQLLEDFKDSAMRKINYTSDEIHWVDGEAEVIDITIFNNSEEIVDSSYDAQINKYLRSQNEYYRELKETCEKIMESGVDYTEDIDYLYKRASDFEDEQKKWRNSNDSTAFSKWRILIKLRKVVPLAKGQKVTGRFGNKSVISKIIPDEEMPYTEDGRIIDIKLNLLAIINRTTSAPLLEICTNCICHSIQLKLREMETIEEKEKLFFDILNLFNEKQKKETWDMYKKYNKQKKEEFWDDIDKDGIFINQPPMFESRAMFYRIMDILDKYSWIQPTNVYINKWGKKQKLLSKFWIGEQYMMKLKQSDRRGFSARNAGAIDTKSLPTRSFKSKAHLEQYSSSCIRFGEFETLNFSIGLIPDDIALFHAMYRTSIKGRRDLGEILFDEPNSDRIQKIDKSYTSRVAEVFTVILKSLSVGLEFVDEDEIINIIDDGDFNIHSLNGKTLLCTNYQYFLLERIAEIEQEILEVNPVITNGELENKVIEELKKRKFVTGKADLQDDLDRIAPFMHLQNRKIVEPEEEPKEQESGEENA